MFKLTGLESIYSLIYDNMIDVFRFVKHCYDLIKEIDPSIPITVGSGDYREIYYLADAQDIISFHTYEANEERLMEIISRAKNAAAEVNKPLLLSEWGSSLYSDPLGYTSGQQADYYKRIMPIVEKAEIGWCIWSFKMCIRDSPCIQSDILLYFIFIERNTNRNRTV